MSGPFYFAWVLPEETSFDPVAHARDDENVFVFTLRQDEGDFAALTIEVRNPRIGLLSPARKVWAWFSYDPNWPTEPPDPRPLFFGRLIGIPSNIFADTVTLDLLARPHDFVARKQAAADALKVLPYYDPVLLTPDAQTNPDTVLEGYPRLWHIDRLTHAVTASDIVIGEDGILSYGENDIFTPQLGMQLNAVPISRVSIRAKFNWSQRVRMTMNLGELILRAWPASDINNRIMWTYTYDGMVGTWPAVGANIEDGWTALTSVLEQVDKYQVRNFSSSAETETKFSDGSGTSMSTSISNDLLINSAGQVIFSVYDIGPVNPEGGQPPPIQIIPPWPGDKLWTKQVKNEVSSSWETNEQGDLTSSSYSVNTEYQAVAPARLRGILILEAATTNRKQHELIDFDLDAGVQPVVTLDESEPVIVSLDSQDLADPVDFNGAVPMQPPWSRSYLETERGKRSLEYLLCLAKARLLSAARAVQIDVPLKFREIFNISLRKSVHLTDRRLPNSEARGKIISYSAALNGDTGEAILSIRLASTIGSGGAIMVLPGEPTWAEETYCGNDYQQFAGGTERLDLDVGYVLPPILPNDDGINFSAGLGSWNAFNQKLKVENGPDAQHSALLAGGYDALAAVPTNITFALKPLNREFETAYHIDTDDLVIPAEIDLTTAALQLRPTAPINQPRFGAATFEVQ